MTARGNPSAKPKSSAADREAVAEASWPLKAGAADYALYNEVTTLFDGEPRLTFKVAGPPVPKQRARTFRDRRTGKIVSATPEKSASYEELVAQLARAACLKQDWPLGGWPDRSVRYAVWIDARMAADEGDADNVAKSYKDALNGIAWPDDRRVCMLMVTKRVAYPTEPEGVVANVWALGTGASKD